MEALRERVSLLRFSRDQVKASGHFKSLKLLEQALRKTVAQGKDRKAAMETTVARAMVRVHSKLRT